MGSSSLISGCGSYAFHQVVADRFAKQGWYSVSDLNVLLRFRARELKGIRKKIGYVPPRALKWRAPDPDG